MYAIIETGGKQYRALPDRCKVGQFVTYCET